MLRLLVEHPSNKAVAGVVKEREENIYIYFDRAVLLYPTFLFRRGALYQELPAQVAVVPF